MSQESISTSAYYDIVSLPFNAAAASNPPPTNPEVCRAFIATVDGTVTLTRVDGVTVAVPVTAGSAYDFRFTDASGDGPILAVW